MQYSSNVNNIYSPKKKTNMKIKEVYNDNFITEIKHLSSYIEEYNYIGMDTEFPGVVFKLDQFTPDFYYKSIEKNVNNLKIIQLGLSLYNSKGENPPETSTWQFNFLFDTSIDKFSNDSISLLANSGIKFEQLKKNGIPHILFAEYFMTSGLLLDKNIHWISYHGASDFAYLLKLAINCNLPNDEKLFTDTLKIYFPSHYDIRMLISGKEQIKGGLNKLAQNLDIDRIGEVHQAGSDSLVTGEVFFALINKGYISNDEIKNYENILYGLGEGEDNNETISYVSFSSNLNTNRNLNNQTALNLHTPIYIPSMAYKGKGNIGNGNGNNYPMMGPVMVNMNGMGNGMMLGYHNNY